MKLLAVDQDLNFCFTLRELFAASGFSTAFEHDGPACIKRVKAEAFDVLILGVNLPGLDGFEVLRRIRAHSSVPVVLLTARAGKADRIQGFECGADDYLIKPFYPEELLARVRAVLRRCGRFRNESPAALSAGDLRLIPGTRTAYYRNQPLDLTAMECEILEQLLRAAGRVVSRDQLSTHLYNRAATPYDRAIDTHVSRIRRKLGGGRGLIISVRGTGYQLSREPDTACN